MIQVSKLKRKLFSQLKRKKLDKRRGPTDNPSPHFVPSLRPEQHGAQKPPLCPIPHSWGIQVLVLPPEGWGLGPKSVSLSGTRGSSPVKRTCCTCVHLPGFMQFSKGLWSQEHQEPWYGLWEGRSYKVPLDRNLMLRIKSLFWRREKCVLAERPDRQTGPSTLQDRQVVKVGWL